MAMNDAVPLPRAVVDELDRIIKFGDICTLTKWNMCLRVLEANKASYKIKSAPDLFIVHHQNRGGLGVNP